jgi:uncharacterized membrane protein YhdT
MSKPSNRPAVYATGAITSAVVGVAAAFVYVYRIEVSKLLDGPPPTGPMMEYSVLNRTNLLWALAVVVVLVIGYPIAAYRKRSSGGEGGGSEWVSVCLLLAVLFLIIGSSVLLLAAAVHFIMRYDGSVLKYFTLASALVGLLVGAGTCWLYEVRKPVDVFGVVGTCVTVLTALGSGIAALAP